MKPWYRQSDTARWVAVRQPLLPSSSRGAQHASLNDAPHPAVKGDGTAAGDGNELGGGAPAPQPEHPILFRTALPRSSLVRHPHWLQHAGHNAHHADAQEGRGASFPSRAPLCGPRIMACQQSRTLKGPCSAGADIPAHGLRSTALTCFPDLCCWPSGGYPLILSSSAARGTRTKQRSTMDDHALLRLTHDQHLVQLDGRQHDRTPPRHISCAGRQRRTLEGCALPTPPSQKTSCSGLALQRWYPIPRQQLFGRPPIRVDHGNLKCA